MIISVKRRIAFIHIQKNGGSSISSMLDSLYGSRFALWSHSTARDAIVRIGMRRWNSLYSFAFIRNPWDRIVSGWLHSRNVAFEEFVRTGKNEHRVRHLWIGQMAYIVDGSGRIAVTELFRFENFSEECARLAARIGIPHTAPPHRRKSLRRHYSEYYTAETREIVSRRFAHEIAYFGYKFEYA